MGDRLVTEPRRVRIAIADDHQIFRDGLRRLLESEPGFEVVAEGTDGLDAARIATLGFGEARPVASNDTPAGRQENRRVEIVVSDAQGAFADDGRRTLL